MLLYHRSSLHLLEQSFQRHRDLGLCGLPLSFEADLVWTSRRAGLCKVSHVDQPTSHVHRREVPGPPSRCRKPSLPLRNSFPTETATKPFLSTFKTRILGRTGRKSSLIRVFSLSCAGIEKLAKRQAMSVEYGLVSDDFIGDGRRPNAPRPAVPGRMEAAPLLRPPANSGQATSFTQIEHVDTQAPANSQPALIYIDGRAVYVLPNPFFRPMMVIDLCV